MRAIPIRERFEEKYIPEPNSGCFLWLGTTNKDHAYGRIRGDKSRKMLLAHRVAWELYCGPIPDDLKVLHKCDNPPCVNPDHLFLGTIPDNVADCVSKNRQRGAPGIKNAKSKLSEDQAIEIKSSTHSLNSLARAFGVTKQTVWGIKHGRIWRHLP